MRVLLVKLSALGDVIQSLPVAMAIRRQRPEAVIDWLVERPNAGILQGHPALNRVLVSPRHDKGLAMLAAAGRLASQLRAHPYDVVLDLQGLMKSAIFVRLASGARKIGFAGGKEPLAALALNERLAPFDPERHALERYLDLLAPLGLERPAWPDYGLEPSPAEMAQARSLLSGSDRQRPLVLMHPVAKWESKLWPEGHWARLGRMLMETGADVAMTGSPADRAVTGRIAAQAGPGIIDLAGRTDLRGLAALQGLASAVVATDTGAMHLAAAMGTPVAALFGPTSATRTGPHGGGHVVLTASLDCRPCFRRQCARPRCMEEITPSQAARAVQEILASNRPRPRLPADEANR